MTNISLALATLWCEEKLYALAAWEEALLGQTFALDGIHLIIFIDENSPECSARLTDFARRHDRTFARITIRASHPIWRGSYHESPYRSGRIALLRQQVLDLFLGDTESAAPLVWWDADLAWDEQFLTAIHEQIVASPGALYGAPYAARGMTLPAAFERHGGILRHLTCAEVYNRPEGIRFLGGGGMGASRDLWQRFQDRGGWRSYAREGTSGTPVWIWYGEDAHVAESLDQNARVLLGVSAWHWDTDGTAAKLMPAGVDICRASAPKMPRRFHSPDTTGERSHAPLGERITIGVVSTDLLARGIEPFIAGLAQQYPSLPAQNMTLLIACEPGSRVALPYWEEWKRSALFTSGLNLLKVWETAAGSDPYQELLTQYLTLPSDTGLFFWGVDTVWDEGVVVDIARSNWPLTTALYAEDTPSLRPNVGLVQAGGKRAFYPPALLGQKATCPCSGMGGLYLSRSLAELFGREGGWSALPPTCDHSVYLSEKTRVPIWIAQHLFGWRSFFHGAKMRVEWDKERHRHCLLSDNARGAIHREY